jgi:hypothetical protein
MSLDRRFLVGRVCSRIGPLLSVPSLSPSMSTGKRTTDHANPFQPPQSPPPRFTPDEPLHNPSAVQTPFIQSRQFLFLRKGIKEVLPCSGEDPGGYGLQGVGSTDIGEGEMGNRGKLDLLLRSSGHRDSREYDRSTFKHVFPRYKRIIHPYHPDP